MSQSDSVAEKVATLNSEKHHALARSSKTAFLSTVKGKRIARERERSA